MTDHDPVNHPTHYASEAKCSGCGESIECIDVVRHMKFSHGNAIKYLWRAGKKEATVQDLKKAIWYIEDMISELEGKKNPNVHRLSPNPNGDEPGWALPFINEAIKDEMYNSAISHVVGTEKCQFDPSQELQHDKSYAFRCNTHDFTMYMPIDKTPDECLVVK